MSDRPQPGPDFSPPAGGQQGWPPQQPQAAAPSAWPPPTQPQQPQAGWAPAPASWPPPDQPQPAWTSWPPPGQEQPGWTSSNQVQPPLQPWSPPPAPRPRPRRRRWLVATGVAVLVALVGTGALIAPSLLNRPASTPAPVSTAEPLVTATPSPQPAEEKSLTTGGDLGVPASFASGTGTGELTIARATWTRAGRMAPPDGRLYLILEVAIACSTGEVDVSSLSLRTAGDPAGQSSFGPDLSSQFPGVRLTAGQKQSGQIGFALPAGQVSVELLDEATLQPVASRVVPGP